jgi:hypothetical protein
MSAGDYKLSEDQRAHLVAVLDRIIPPSPERGLPGAGELGVADTIEAELRRSPQLRLVVEPGLAACAALSRASAAEDADLMTAVQTAAPALVPTLLFHTYIAYYQHPRVTEQLGLQGRPPHPIGYPMEASDLSILDPVRRRGKLYRDMP